MLGSQVESEVGDDEAVTTHVEARMAVMNWEIEKTIEVIKAKNNI